MESWHQRLKAEPSLTRCPRAHLPKNTSLSHRRLSVSPLIRPTGRDSWKASLGLPLSATLFPSPSRSCSRGTHGNGWRNLTPEGDVMPAYTRFVLSAAAAIGLSAFSFAQGQNLGAQDRSFIQ